MSDEVVTQRGGALYDRGCTVAYACKADPRFSYVLYVPEHLDEPSADQPSLLVAMHGTGRANVQYRDAFAEFGRYNNCVILAPLFPVGVLGDENRNGYKYIQEDNIRYDEIVLAMVREVEVRLNLTFPKLLMFGFSGGGHFVHRFTYLHPERVGAVCVGAPGSVTLPDEQHDWWIGLRDIKALFDIDINYDALRRVCVQVVVGAADMETWEITHAPGSAHWMEGANSAGRTRVDRARTLTKSLQDIGVKADLTLVPNVAHDMMGVLPTVKDYFRRFLREHRKELEK